MKMQKTRSLFAALLAVLLSPLPLLGTQCTIAVSASPGNGGTVSGGGTFASGSSQTVTAVPNNGWTFMDWMESRAIVSLTNEYQFTLITNRTLVANFATNSALGFTASIDPDSVPGNLHGLLHLYFDTNAWNSFDMPPYHGSWNLGSGFQTTFTNAASGDQVSISLRMIGETPAELYLYGAIAVTVPGLSTIWTSAMGGPGGICVPGVPNVLPLHNIGENQVIKFSMGKYQFIQVTNKGSFSLDVPWNGVSCNTTGTWSARYAVALPPPTHLSSISMANGNMIFTVTGTATDYTLQSSTNMVDWNSIYQFTIPNSGVVALTNSVNTNSQQFYRAVFYLN